jgi:hypothetical protein
MKRVSVSPLRSPKEGFCMITRRSFFGNATSAIFCAPAIVRAGALMPLRGIVFPIEPNYFGFVDRLYVHTYVAQITRLQNNGLSLYEIAAGMNKQKLPVMNGRAWNAQRVLGILKRHEQIQCVDAFIRAGLPGLSSPDNLCS